MSRKKKASKPLTDKQKLKAQVKSEVAGARVDSPYAFIRSEVLHKGGRHKFAKDLLREYEQGDGSEDAKNRADTALYRGFAEMGLSQDTAYMATLEVQLQTAYLGCGRAIYHVDPALMPDLLNTEKNASTKLSELHPKGGYLRFDHMGIESFESYEGVLVEPTQDKEGNPLLKLCIIPEAWGTEAMPVVGAITPPRVSFLFLGDPEKCFSDVVSSDNVTLDEQSEADIGQLDGAKVLSLVLNTLLHIQTYPERQRMAVEPSSQKCVDKVRHDIRSTKAVVDDQLLLDCGFININHVH
ncbi:hypothetical protein [Neptuniibacter sp. QD37_11]|uniref:hypothetical protein n=1 Tax=Neptuniibacter sp. QD37_11 TaxID=3398209 RepID=UPI0039F578E7